MDGGDVLAQRHVFIRTGDTAEELWRRDLAPLGVELLAQTVAAYAETGYQHGTAQDEALATWEPSIDRPPAFRPDLLMIEGPKAPKPRRVLPPGLHPWLVAEAEHDGVVRNAAGAGMTSGRKPTPTALKLVKGRQQGRGRCRPVRTNAARLPVR